LGHRGVRFRKNYGIVLSTSCRHPDGTGIAIPLIVTLRSIKDPEIKEIQEYEAHPFSSFRSFLRRSVGDAGVGAGRVARSRGEPGRGIVTGRDPQASSPSSPQGVLRDEQRQLDGVTGG
jgi:hypothetical protein